MGLTETSEDQSAFDSMTDIEIEKLSEACKVRLRPDYAMDPGSGLRQDHVIQLEDESTVEIDYYGNDQSCPDAIGITFIDQNGRVTSFFYAEIQASSPGQTNPPIRIVEIHQTEYDNDSDVRPHNDYYVLLDKGKHRLSRRPNPHNPKEHHQLEIAPPTLDTLYEALNQAKAMLAPLLAEQE